MLKKEDISHRINLKKLKFEKKLVNDLQLDFEDQLFKDFLQ